MNSPESVLSGLPGYAAFVPWGTSHIAVLAGSFIIPVLLALPQLGRAPGVYDRFVRWIVALITLVSWLGWYVVGFAHGWLDVSNMLPLYLCDWAAMAVAFALIGRGQFAYDLAYFWALAGTTQALISPDIPYDFPEVRMLSFSGFHAGIMVGVLYLTFSGQMRPNLRSVKRAIAMSALYSLTAGVVDMLMGVNYGYLRAKPDVVSALDWMPAWPGYLPLLVLCAIGGFGLCYAPFYLYDRFLRRVTP